MLQIAICDDVVEQTFTPQKYIREYCEGNHAEYRLYIYTSGEELICNAKKRDIIFLDIEMPGLDGIMTGRAIWAENGKCRIQYVIHQSEIHYVVTYDSYCEYWVKNRVLRSEDSLKELEKKLDNRLFFRINRKYIVNMAQVKHYKNGVLQIGDVQVSVSRRRKKDFEQAYMEFDLKYR